MKSTRRLGFGLCLGLALAWAAGLLVASYQLQDWQARLVRVLVHLQANDIVRAKALAAGQGVRSGWYRDRALALLEAVEQLHEPSPWTLVMPGSWRVFDDLEARATQRIGHAFGQIVVETIRREMEKRAAHLAGAALDPYTEALDASAGCQGPALAGHPAATLDVAQMPEFEAMARFLMEAGRMDQALASLHAALRPPHGDAAALQRVIGYSLGADLSGPASRSLALLRQQPDAADPRGEALTQCLAQALQDRLTTDNPLLASERAVGAATSPQVLFPPGRDRDEYALAQRLRAAIAQIERQRILLASADHDWMHPQARGLGTAHDSLLAQVGRLPLLGPALASELATQARERRAQWQSAMKHLTEDAQAGLAWDDAQGRFVQTQRRRDLHAALIALLRTPAAAIAPSDLERLTAQDVSCVGPCPARAAVPRARWDSAGEFATPASSAD